MTPYLLDTQALLWWAFDPKQLSDDARIAIADGRSYVFVSAATAWEISIKRRLGKLHAPGCVRQLLKDNRFLQLPVSFEHAEATEHLPLHHKDPFDRLLVAQAKADRLTLITRDRDIQKYDVPMIAA